MVIANSNVKVAIIEKQPKKLFENPKNDGRELALTHNSVNMLKDLGVWQQIPKKLISIIKEARVLDGNSKYSLDDLKNKKLFIEVGKKKYPASVILKPLNSKNIRIL